jgi:ABC-type glycerol-3-phosphate transport system permease component
MSTRVEARVEPIAREFVRKRTRRIGFATIAQYGVLLILLILSFFILALMVALSLRHTLLIYLDFWRFPWPPTFFNYDTAMGDLIRPLIRTMAVCFGSIAGILAVSSVASYGFARIKFPGRELFFYLTLALMMVPGVILLTPHFIMATDFHLRGSLWGLIAFYVAGGLPFAIFLITTFFRGQPAEIYEAARIDGASEFRSLIGIALPLSFPILVTVAVMNFISLYSDFIWPSLMLPESKQTLMLALANYNPQVSEFANRIDIGMQTAGYVFAAVPQIVLFAFGMKYFIQGVTSGSLKA